MPPIPRAIAAIASAIEKLMPQTPGARPAEALRARCERLLMSHLSPGGLRAADRLLAALTRRFPESSPHRSASLRMWRLRREEPPRVFDIYFHATRGFRMLSVTYGRIKEPPRLTARQKKKAVLQEAFYARYLEVGQRAYAPGARTRLSPDDRCLLLIGELEADVNNGGFDQYLLNKGRR